MPQTECPAQEEAWRSTTERTRAFRRLMSQCGSGVENCLLPDSVAGFVEGEHCSVLLKALGDGHLRPIGSMVDASVRDRNKPGACYVYFRVMKRGDAHSHGLWQRGLLPDGSTRRGCCSAQDMDRQQGRVCQ